MRSTCKLIGELESSLAILLVLAFPQGSRADNCSGHDSIVNKSYEKIELAKNHVLSSFSDYIIRSSDNWPSINGTTGECHGSWLDTPDGKSRGWGYCLFKDKDGDTESAAWEWPSPAGGTWKVTGGTGKFAGKTDSGWAKPLVRDGKMSLVQWGATCN